MDLTRRGFLIGVGAAGAALAVPWALRVPGVAYAVSGSSPALTPYVDALPIPPAAPAFERTEQADFYRIRMLERPFQFHRDLPSATAWGYWAETGDDDDEQGQQDTMDHQQTDHRLVGIGYLGPTIGTSSGRPVVVQYINNLPGRHLLSASVDPTLWKTVPPAPPDGPVINGMVTDRNQNVPTTAPNTVWTCVHVHGGQTPPQFDGHPQSWFTSDGSQHGERYFSWQHRIPVGPAPANGANFVYPNQQPATLLWFHDHAMSITRLNVYAGLAALYIVRDGFEKGLNLPAGRFEVPLVIQDKSFDANGAMSYPTQGVTAFHPQWVPEFFGDVAVINAKAFPFLNVEARRYRFRVVNGSQARFYHLSLDNGMPFWLIGTEEGFMPAPARLTSITLAPAERADIIIDFTSVPVGTRIVVTNDAPAPFPSGGEVALPNIMQFRVVPATSRDTTTPPAQLDLAPAFTRLTVTDSTPRREIVLHEDEDPATGNPKHVLLNQLFFDESLDLDQSRVKAGSTEVWQFINLTVDAHPMHLHLVRFQVVDRQPFDVSGYTAAYLAWVAAGRPAASKPVLASFLMGPAESPGPDEAGWKDTVRALPGLVTRIVARFDVLTSPALFGDPATATKLPADYVYHCHILEHEENEMMRPYQVVP